MALRELEQKVDELATNIGLSAVASDEKAYLEGISLLNTSELHLELQITSVCLDYLTGSTTLRTLILDLKRFSDNNNLFTGNGGVYIKQTGKLCKILAETTAILTYLQDHPVDLPLLSPIWQTLTDIQSLFQQLCTGEMQVGAVLAVLDMKRVTLEMILEKLKEHKATIERKLHEKERKMGRKLPGKGSKSRLFVHPTAAKKVFSAKRLARKGSKLSNLAEILMKFMDCKRKTASLHPKAAKRVFSASNHTKFDNFRGEFSGLYRKSWEIDEKTEESQKVQKKKCQKDLFGIIPLNSRHCRIFGLFKGNISKKYN